MKNFLNKIFNKTFIKIAFKSLKSLYFSNNIMFKDKICNFLLNYLSRNKFVNSNLHLVKKQSNIKKNQLILMFKNHLNLNLNEIYFELFFTLLNNEIFNSFSKNKIFISIAYTDTGSYTLHCNLLVTPLTTIKNLVNLAYPYMASNICEPYFEDINYIEVIVWNIDNDLNKKIKKPFKNDTFKNDTFKNDNTSFNSKSNNRFLTYFNIFNLKYNILKKRLFSKLDTKTIYKSICIYKGYIKKGFLSKLIYFYNIFYILKKQFSLVLFYLISKLTLIFNKVFNNKLFYFNNKIFNNKLFYFNNRKYNYSFNSQSIYPNFNRRSFYTSAHFNYDFTVLKKPNALTLFYNKKNIAAMDFETMRYFDRKSSFKKWIQIPTLIPLAYYDSNRNIQTIYSLINLKTLKDQGYSIAIAELFNDFFNQVKQHNLNNYTIFMHNLGKFDGFILISNLLKHLKIQKGLHTIIDNKQSFIQIKSENFGITLIWKDSLRIFPVSLNDFCKIMNVQGKTNEYKKIYNSLRLFKNEKLLNEWIKYGINDSKILLEALDVAQNFYIDNYSVDIATIWSTSTLSLKIFRQQFLKKTIPSLNSNVDKFVRKAYFGGATDHYQLKAEKLYYYDVNSLYPKAMCNLMPLKQIAYIRDFSNMDFNNFFGFCIAKIETPTNLKIYLLFDIILYNLVHNI